MEKFRRGLESLEKSLRKFEEAVTNPLFTETFSLEFQIEILTKRFEYTYEALWKAVKEFLRLRGIECYSPRACFEALFKEGLISEEVAETLFEAILIRNSLVHIYDEEEAFITLKNLRRALFYPPLRVSLKSLKIFRGYGARSMTALMACADSGAGTRPSVRAKSKPASKTSL